MLNNNIFLSILISTLSSLLIYISIYKDQDKELYKNDIIKIFFIIFSICLGTITLKNKCISGSNDQLINLPSGETSLTHYSRPPF